MSAKQEKELLENFSSSFELDDVFLVPNGQTVNRQREEAQEIFFNSRTDSSRLLEPKQIRIKKPRPISREEQEHLICNKKLTALYRFFDANPFISLSNFQTAHKLLASYFDDPTKFIDRIVKLKEYLPQGFEQRHRFGLLKIKCVYRGNHIKISLYRSKLKDMEQHISLNLTDNKPDSLLVFSQWNWKNKKYQIIRSVDINNRRNNGSPSSIEFDAKIWQAYNSGGIQRTHFLKTLDCIERNYNKLGALINAVNKKSILNLFDKPLINNASIKTDNQNTSSLSFRTNTSQKVEIIVSKHTTSLTIEH